MTNARAMTSKVCSLIERVVFDRAAEVGVLLCDITVDGAVEMAGQHAGTDGDYFAGPQHEQLQVRRDAALIEEAQRLVYDPVL